MHVMASYNMCQDTRVTDLCSIQALVHISTSTQPIASAFCKKLNILVLVQGLSSSPEMIKVSITDSQEPLLLLNTVISAVDYPALRRVQGLLVEFHEFPQHLVELLTLCQREQDSTQPKFTLNLTCSAQTLNTINSSNASITGILSSTDWQLEVLESNVFKRLSHLSLQVSCASVEEKLNHLVSCIKSAESSKDVQLCKMQDSYKNLQLEVQNYQQQLLQCKEQLSATEQKVAEEREHHKQQLRIETEKVLKERSDSDRKLARMKQELESCISDQKQKINILLSENKTATEHRAREHSSNKELKEKLTANETRYDRLQTEHNLLEQKFKQIQHLKNDLQEQLNVSRQEKQNLLRSLQAVQKTLDAATKNKDDLEANLAAAVEKCTKRENSATALFIELQKNLQIVSALKGEITKSQKAQSDLQSEVYIYKQAASDLRVELEDMQKKITTKEQMLTDLKQKVNGLEEDKSKLNEELSVCKLQFESSKKLVDQLRNQLETLQQNMAIMSRAPLAEAYFTLSGLDKHKEQCIMQPCLDTLEVESSKPFDKFKKIKGGLLRKNDESKNLITSKSSKQGALTTSTPLCEPGTKQSSALNSLSSVKRPGAGLSKN